MNRREFVKAVAISPLALLLKPAKAETTTFRPAEFKSIEELLQFALIEHPDTKFLSVNNDEYFEAKKSTVLRADELPSCPIVVMTNDQPKGFVWGYDDKCVWGYNLNG